MANSLQPPHIAPNAPNVTLWKTLQTFNATRVLIAVVLLVYLSLNTKQGFWVTADFLYQEACIAYLILAVAFVAVTALYRRQLLWQLVVQVAVDIAVISILYIGAGGAKSGLAILYLFPLAGSAILAPLLMALCFVSVVSLVLLAEGARQYWAGLGDAAISQSGLYGAAFFAAVLAINRLAARLIKQEQIVAQREQDLQTQQAINRLIIADMSDGILVLDHEANIVTANPAAQRILDLPPAEEKSDYKLALKREPNLRPIAQAFASWLRRQDKQETVEQDNQVLVVIKPNKISLTQDSIGPRGGGVRELAVRLRLRFALVHALGQQQKRAVIFLQDVGEIENQAQQLKLASMGRLTASIAHEVRNPLSAVSHAAGLLSEEISLPSQLRLVKIISDNVLRLNRMIEDILKLSRKAQMQPEPIALFPLFTEILEEFQETHKIRSGMIRIRGTQPYRIWFDPLHLREVVVNLLSNASRYASGQDNSIQVEFVASATNRLELHVQDDGPPMSPEVRAHLFEPFYTTSSKGTGLGLYLARELCLNNGAMLDYEYRTSFSGTAGGQPSGRFVITFAKIALA